MLIYVELHWLCMLVEAKIRQILNAGIYNHIYLYQFYDDP